MDTTRRHLTTTARRALAAEGERAIPMVLSTAEVNSYGEIVDQASWRLDRFARNPVALYQHDASSDPIGYWRDVRVEDGELRATLVLYDDATSPEAARVWARYQQGGPIAASVGFDPGREVTEERDGREVTVLYDSTLVEASVVSVPADPGAVARRTLGGQTTAGVRTLARMDIPAIKTAIEEVLAALDPEAMAPQVEMLRSVLAAIDGPAEEMEAAPKPEEAMGDDPSKMKEGDPKGEKKLSHAELRARAAQAVDLEARVKTLSAEVSQLRAARDADERARVLSAHRTRGALTPAMEADAELVKLFAEMPVKSLDAMLSRLAGLPTAPVTVTAPSREADDIAGSIEFAKRFGIPADAVKRAAANSRGGAK